MADPTPLPSNPEHAYDYREFHVQSITLISKNGSATDIRGMVVELIVRQDMMVGYMHGEMMLVDTLDMIASHDVTGGEYVFLHLTSPAYKESIRKVFRIFKVSNREPQGSNGQRYLINFISPEMYLSNLVRISRAYKGRTLSDIVTDILTNYLHASKYTVDATSDGMDIVVANKRPTEAINWLASRATSGEEFGWIYYENLDGLQFRSLPKLYTQNPVNDKPYTREAVSVSKNLADAIGILDKYTVKRDFDLLHLTNKGGIAQRMIGVDPFYRTITVNESSLTDLPHMESVPHVPNVRLPNGINLYENYEADQFALLHTEDTPTEKGNRANIWIRRKMLLAALHHSLIELTMPGNMSLQAGKLVKLDFRLMMPITDNNMLDEIRSGTYLINSVSHKFDIPNTIHETIFSVVRDSLPRYRDGVDTDLMNKMVKLNEQ